MGKTRPVLSISVPVEDNDRVVVTTVPHTTTVRGSRFEIQIAKKFLKPGAFMVQGIATVSKHQLIKKMGELTPGEMKMIESAVKEWLGLT